MKILKLTLDNFDEAVKTAADMLKGSGVVVSPTDTVYGLLANAENESAVKKVYRIKKRDPGKPLPFFIKDIAAAKRLALVGIPEQEMLQDSWPGKTTFVLKTGPKKTVFGSEKNTIALRIPDLPFLDKLFAQIGFPLTGTSANLAGHPASTKIKEVLDQLGGEPDLAIDAGNLPESKPSAIIDLTHGSPEILR
jgi:L-threonylcarbamoyladenylate synthase